MKNFFFPVSVQIPERDGTPHSFGKGFGKSVSVSLCSVFIFFALAQAAIKLHGGCLHGPAWLCTLRALWPCVSG